MDLADLTRKRKFGAVQLAVLVVGFALVACSPFEETVNTRTFRLLWPSAGKNGSVEYGFQNVEVETLSDPDHFRGDVAEVIVDPKSSGGKVVGDDAVARYAREGSVLRPADFVTLQAVTVYAHLERLSKVDRSLGLHGSLRGREKIGLLARIPEGPRSSTILMNNAVYDGGLDALFIVPFDQQTLPLSMNAGVIAHEHFHRLFQAAILDPLKMAARSGTIPYGWDDSIGCAHNQIAYQMKQEAPTGGDITVRVYNQVLVRGMNEGLADYWGWAYSGDETFVGRSLGDGEDRERRLDTKVTGFPTPQELKNTLLVVDRSGRSVLKSEGGRIQAAYRFGTQYARMLRGMTEAMITSGIPRGKAIEGMRRALAMALTDLNTKVLAAWGKTELPTDAFVGSVAEVLRSPKFQKESGLTVPHDAVCAEMIRVGISKGGRGETCATEFDFEPLQNP